MWQASVILTKANLTDLQDYHCIRCKGLMFKINRDFAALWMGAGYPVREIPNGMGWVQHKCRGCQYIYNVYFQ